MPTENGIEFDGADMFVVRYGKRIAKRDQQTKTWIALEPGWQVAAATCPHLTRYDPKKRGRNCARVDALVRL
jgi:hypothetical protein